MTLTGYGFALFIFILACLFAMLCKYLFARSKMHMMMLNEKEKKLLTFYSTLEDMMDEFNGSVLKANNEIEQQVAEMLNIASTVRANVQAASSVLPAPQRQAPATQTSATQANTWQMPQPTSAPVNNTGYETPKFTPFAVTTLAEAEEGKDNRAGRHARILALWQHGYTRAQIARELSITLSEVDLVLGIAGQRIEVRS